MEGPGDGFGGRNGGESAPPRKGRDAVTSPVRRDDARDLSSLNVEDFATKVAGHHFPLGVVAGSMAMVLCAGTRLRRVASALAPPWSWSTVAASTPPAQALQPAFKTSARFPSLRSNGSRFFKVVLRPFTALTPWQA